MLSNYYDMFDFIQTITEWYMSHINYFTVMLLMAIESSFIPFPSEIVIPPAAWKAAQGDLNIYLVTLSGTIGALIGALFNYYLALYLGRIIIYRLAETRFAHLLLINRHGIEKAESYFLKHGNSSTFIGRLVPAIRQLISIPAGLARMKIRPFIIYTLLGSGLWNIILAILGYSLYSQKERLEKYYHEISMGFLIIGMLFIAYLIFRAFKNKK